jgi:hypothetical protein
MHLLPSRGRPGQLQRFFDEGKPEQPGVVITEEDQAEAYSRIAKPTGWRILVVPGPRLGFAAAANLGFAAFPNEPWYGQSGDDSVGRTPHWDTLLGEAATPNKIVWPNDLFGGRCTQPFVGGDLCRALGWFSYPKFGHLYTDTLWGDIQRGLGPGGYMPHIVYEHLHWCAGKGVFDQTARERKTSGDEIEYRKVDLQGLLEKLKPCITPRGTTAASAGSRSSTLSTSAYLL